MWLIFALLSAFFAAATSILAKEGINFEIDGDGGFVEKQLPPAGTKINLNDYIVLITN